LKNLGYEYTNSVLNLGVLGLMIALFLAMSIVLAPLIWILSKILKISPTKKLSRVINELVYFSMIITISMVGFVPIAISLYLH
jgi:cell division protein FtsX